MNTIFAAPGTASSQESGLVQIETLSMLESMTGIPAVEWLDYPTETNEHRAMRLERIADAMLELDDSTARRVAAMHREILAEPAYVEIETNDRVFGPVVTHVLVDALAVVPTYTGKTRSGMGASAVATVRRALAEVPAA